LLWLSHQGSDDTDQLTLTTGKIPTIFPAKRQRSLGQGREKIPKPQLFPDFSNALQLFGICTQCNIIKDFYNPYKLYQ